MWRRIRRHRPLGDLRQDAAKPLRKLERLTGKGQIKKLLTVARSRDVEEIMAIRREARKRYWRTWLKHKSDQFVSVGIIMCTLYFIAIFFVAGLFSGQLNG